MKLLSTALLAASLFSGLAMTAGCESHTDTKDSTTLTGKHKHEEDTTTRNPITGDVSTEHRESKTP